MKVVINTCYGGFSLSNEARSAYALRKGLAENEFSMYEIARDDPALVAVVEELGKRANGDFARLKVVEIPDDVQWEIDDYDGNEVVAEKHRIWS